MSSKKVGAGDIIEARCTRCREVMNHTIVAMVQDKVARVQCNTCNGIHNYKAVAATKTPATRTAATKAPAAPRASRKDPGAADRAEWEELIPTMKMERLIEYQMTAKFKVKDLVRHSVFGMGVVQRLISPNKVEILFQAGRKLLRCQ